MLLQIGVAVMSDNPHTYTAASCKPIQPYCLYAVMDCDPEQLSDQTTSPYMQGYLFLEDKFSTLQAVKSEKNFCVICEYRSYMMT